MADVWRHVFQYIALLCAPGAVTHTLHDEVTALRRLAYDYRERPDPFSYTSSLASQLQLQPPAHVLHTMYHVPLDFSESAVRDLLAALGPESAMFLWTSHAFGDAVELTDEWYQQRYSVGTVPSEWVARCAPRGYSSSALWLEFEAPHGYSLKCDCIPVGLPLTSMQKH